MSLPIIVAQYTIHCKFLPTDKGNAYSKFKLVPAVEVTLRGGRKGTDNRNAAWASVHRHMPCGIDQANLVGIRHGYLIEETELANQSEAIAIIKKHGLGTVHHSEDGRIWDKGTAFKDFCKANLIFKTIFV